MSWRAGVGRAGVLTGLALVLMVACGSDGGGGGQAAPEPCGGETCSEREQCDESGREPVCECTAAYQGADCESCAVGYEEISGLCVAVTIDCDDNPCGVHGACVSEAGKPDICECEALYTGPTCAQCEPGYQDNDGDGECSEGCDHPMPEQICESPRVCEDTSGASLCVCPVGSTGERCELCEDGYARRGDEACYMLCNNPKVVCPEAQRCFDDDGRQPAACACVLGYVGDECTTCDVGFELQGEFCVRSDLTGFDLLTIASYPAGTVLAGLSSTSGALTPLVHISGVQGLVYDRAGSRLFVAGNQGISSLDMASGEKTEIAAESIGHGKPIAFDTRSGQVVSFRSDDYSMFAVDPATGAVTERGNPGISWVWDATYGASSDRIYALRSQGLVPSVHAVEPNSGAVTDLGSPAGFAASNEALGIAVLPSGELAVTGSVATTADEAVGDACRRSADRLGFDGYADAPYNVIPAGDATTFLTATGATGKELVIYTSYSSPPGASIHIDVMNPDAFICAITYEEDLNFVVNADASWAGGMIYTYKSAVTAVVPPGFQADTPIILHGGRDSDLTAAALLEQAFRALSADEAEDRHFPPLSDFGAYERTQAAHQVSVVSLPDLSTIRTTAVQGRLLNGLSAY